MQRGARRPRPSYIPMPYHSTHPQHEQRPPRQQPPRCCSVAELPHARTQGRAVDSASFCITNHVRARTSGPRPLLSACLPPTAATCRGHDRDGGPVVGKALRLRLSPIGAKRRRRRAKSAEGLIDGSRGQRGRRCRCACNSTRGPGCMANWCRSCRWRARSPLLARWATAGGSAGRTGPGSG